MLVLDRLSFCEVRFVYVILFVAFFCFCFSLFGEGGLKVLLIVSVVNILCVYYWLLTHTKKEGCS